MCDPMTLCELDGSIEFAKMWAGYLDSDKWAGYVATLVREKKRAMALLGAEAIAMRGFENDDVLKMIVNHAVDYLSVSVCCVLRPPCLRAFLGWKGLCIVS